jgi:hypothetical protein
VTEHLKIYPNSIPAIRVYNPKVNAKYKFEESPEDLKKATAEEMINFVNKVQGEFTEPYILSLPVPDEADNVGPVRNLVATNFENWVQTNDKPVAMLFYA